MIVKDYEDGKLVTLSKPFDTRAKVLNTLYFFVLFIAASAVLRQLFFLDYNNTPALVIIVIAVIVFYIASYRFINKAVYSEKLIVNKTHLKLLQNSFFKTKVTCYDISKISNFRHLNKPELTRHPLAGETFDYLGFQTEQKVINEMHGDHRVAFDYDGTAVKFGENVYSWHFEGLEILLYDITGNDFRYDDEFEKTFRA